MRSRAGVLFTWQPPALLSRLATSELWQCYHVPLGRPDGSAAQPAGVPEWAGEPVEHVVGHACAAHEGVLDLARRAGAPVTWLFHDHRRGSIPPPHYVVERHITLSWVASAAYRRVYPNARSFVITPAYEPAKPPSSNRHAWVWRRDELWSVVDGQAREFGDAVATVVDLACKTDRHTRYGEGQPGGHLDGAARARRLEGGSAYVSVLPPWAGFGLVEHECMAAGMPVVGRPWIDMNEELSAAYGLSNDLNDLGFRAMRLCEDERYAKHVSQIGRSFIRDWRSPQIMDAGIGRFLAEAKS